MAADYTSKNIQNRRVHKEAYSTLSSSEASNLSYRQGGFYMITPVSDQTDYSAKVMPLYSDEHIFYPSAAGTAAGSSSDVAVAGRALSDIVPTDTLDTDWPHLGTDVGWVATGSPASAVHSATGGYNDADSVHSTGTDGCVKVTIDGSGGADQGIKSLQSISTTNGETYYTKVVLKVDVGITEIRVLCVKNNGNPNGGFDKTYAIPADNDGETWYTLLGAKRETSAASGNAKVIHVLTTASAPASKTFTIDNLGFYELHRTATHTFTVSNDIWNSVHIGSYVIFHQLAGTNLDKPWENPPNENNLWAKTFIGQISAMSSSSVGVKVGLCPLNSDFATGIRDGYTGKNYLPWNGFPGEGLTVGVQAWCFYDLCWVMKKSGFTEVTIMDDDVNFSLYQYDDIPGGIQTDTESGSGMFYDDFEIASLTNNLLDWNGSSGTTLHGRFKSIRLSSNSNAEDTGRLLLTAAPERE